MNVENGPELFVEIIDGNRAGLVQDLGRFHSVVIVWIRIVLAGE